MDGVIPSPTGVVSTRHTRWRDRSARIRQRYVRDETIGCYRPERERLLCENTPLDTIAWQQQLLAWLRDHVHPSIPRHWYELVIGHDLHLSLHGMLHVRHWHNEPDPWSDGWGWTENVGLVSCGKVTTAFRDFASTNFVTDSTTYGDFKFHRAGTDNTAEANSQTALIADVGLEATGNQTNPTAPTYRSVGTITGDTTETWQEHGLFLATGGASTMLDRSVLSPTVAMNSSDTCEFTYTLTCNAEAASNVVYAIVLALVAILIVIGAVIIGL